MTHERVVAIVFVGVEAYNRLGNHYSRLQLSLLQVLLHPLPKHGLKRLERLILIVLLQQIRKLGHLLALLAAGNHLHAINLKPNNLIGPSAFLAATHVAQGILRPSGSLMAQLLATELVITLHPRALGLVVLYLEDWLRDATYSAHHLVFAIDFHYYF